ncbi:acetate kinase [Candidatus Gracilibacteria bacterium]|nr:acetate kinase [Candidatus Gracilibacteria bacterium]
MFLVINSGSSSIKFKLFENKIPVASHTKLVLGDKTGMTDKKENLKEIMSGIAEKIGSKDSFLDWKFEGKEGETKDNFRDYKNALEEIVDVIEICGIKKSQIKAVGHRVVHGGEKFQKSVIIDSKVIKAIRGSEELAPIHNKINLECIMDCKKLFPKAKQIAVFDTAFSQTMEEENYIYAIPYKYYKKYKIRKYGFHGISHHFVYDKLINEFKKIKLKNSKNLKVITCHVGNGASISAIKNGKVIQNSMGMTPLEGLIMGTRSGDIDPAIIPFLAKKEKLSAEQVENILNKESGLKGLRGKSGDMRDIVAAYKAGDKKAKMIVKMYVNRIIKYIGAYTALLGGVDAIVMTAGVLERSALIRKLICKKLEWLGVKIDSKKNNSNLKEGEISSKDSKVKVIVIPTNEGLMIAKEMSKVIGN